MQKPESQTSVENEKVSAQTVCTVPGRIISYLCMHKPTLLHRLYVDYFGSNFFTRCL